MKNQVGQTFVLEEPLLFERTRPGAVAVNLTPLDVPAVDVGQILKTKARTQLARLPEVSEPEVVRHFTRLSTWNYAIDLGIYPLGSCTMKYNPRFNEEVARSSAITQTHPYEPVGWTQGHLRIMHELINDLKAVTGLQGISLQPAAGAHGEFTGLLVISAYHKSKGRNPRTILTADTAHGTNPASAALAGYQTVQLTTVDGVITPEAVEAAMSNDVAALMTTNPNTLGVFEKHIKQIADILHQRDALLYIDGANLNAVLGIARPGDCGADVLQFNLHKTFSTPHGGGGPGSGPIAVSEKLIPFLPTPQVIQNAKGQFELQNHGPLSIGRVKSFYGNFGMFVRAWCYMRSLGSQGLRSVSENAIINANYIRARLKEYFHLPINAPSLHEVVFNDKNQRSSGLETTTIAKNLIDHGMHPPTVHFPLCVKNAIMIEPTETESKAELDRLIDALIAIATNAKDTPAEAPFRAFRQRVDETKAARDLRLTYSFPTS